MLPITSTSLAIIGTLLAPSASAWGIAFYTGENCNQDEHFVSTDTSTSKYQTNQLQDSTMYSGDNTIISQCLEVGEPGENCKWVSILP